MIYRWAKLIVLPLFYILFFITEPTLNVVLPLFFTSYFLKPTLCISNSRDKYVRPYDKSTFVQELENNLMHDLAFDLEFSELEQLADDTIQVQL